MGLSATVWFVIAVVAILAGLALLFGDRLTGGGGGGSTAKDRKRWAAMRGWEYLDSDPVLPSRWRYGTISQGGPGVARRLMSGDVPTPDGDRQAYVFDHEQAGRLSSVLVAVHVTEPLAAAIELRLPSAPLPDDAGLDLLEPVGERYAFVADADAARPLLTSRLAAAADQLGDDVELVWAEESWVLATAPLDSTTDRLQDLLADLAEVASVLDKAEAERVHSPETAPTEPVPSGSTRHDARGSGPSLVKGPASGAEPETEPDGTPASRDR